MGQWVDDAEGRHWLGGEASIVRQDNYRAVESAGAVHQGEEPLYLALQVTLYCRVDQGQPLPNVEGVVQQITRAVTVGGSQSRRLEAV